MSDDIVTRLLEQPNNDPKLLDLMDDAVSEIERLRAIAAELYEITVRTWCWHCGVETRRDDRVDATIDRYRKIVSDRD